MEAGTLHCPSCGAAVGSNDLRCPYCASELATVACPRCFAMVSLHAQHCPQCGGALESGPAEVTQLACPDCRVPLGARTLGGLNLDLCGQCGGLWVSQKAFERIAADRAERGEVMGALLVPTPTPVHLSTVRYRPCPCCGKFMNRQNYARISGVVLDLCKEHGIWFDRDELRQVLTFIEGGGMVRSRARELSELDEQRRLASTARDIPVAGGGWTEGDFSSRHGGANLAGVLESLVSAFFR